LPSIKFKFTQPGKSEFEFARIGEAIGWEGRKIPQVAVVLNLVRKFTSAHGYIRFSQFVAGDF
jgi:hypothetical protein